MFKASHVHFMTSYVIKMHGVHIYCCACKWFEIYTLCKCGVNTFQGIKIGVIKQINTNYAPFSIGVHCMAHKYKLTFKTLSTLGIINSIEDLL